MDERHTCWTSAVLWMVLGLPVTARRTCQQNCGPWQFYGWIWALTKYQKQQNCWTSPVLWMVLGPLKKVTTKLLDLSSFMDGFGPFGLSVIKTVDLCIFMDGFGPNEKERQNCRRSAVLWMFWALKHTSQQNCGPWQFYGWVWHSEEETVQLSNIKGFIIKVGLWYHS